MYIPSHTSKLREEVSSFKDSLDRCFWDVRYVALIVQWGLLVIAPDFIEDRRCSHQRSGSTVLTTMRRTRITRSNGPTTTLRPFVKFMGVHDCLSFRASVPLDSQVWWHQLQDHAWFYPHNTLSTFIHHWQIKTGHQTGPVPEQFQTWMHIAYRCSAIHSFTCYVALFRLYNHCLRVKHPSTGEVLSHLVVHPNQPKTRIRFINRHSCTCITVYMVYGACTNHVLLWYVAIHIHSGSYVCWGCRTTDCK